MDTLINNLLQNLIGQGPSQKYWYIGLVILLIGLPYIIRTYRQVFSPKSYLEIRKLQLDILKTYADLYQSDDTSKVAKVKQMADLILDDPRITEPPYLGVFANWSLSLVKISLWLFPFFIGIALIWSPLIFMAKHNWPQLVRVLVIPLGIMIPIFLAKATDGEIKFVNAMSLGILSLPVVVVISIAASLISELIESFISVF